MWLLLYFFFQIYFDFSGYTDIAIGLECCWELSFRRIRRAVSKPNLTQFLEFVHMTPDQWFRAYYFNALVRWLRKRKRTSHRRLFC